MLWGLKLLPPLIPSETLRLAGLEVSRSCSTAAILQVFAIEFVTFAIEFVPFTVEFVTFAVEFVGFAIELVALAIDLKRLQ